MSMVRGEVQSAESQNFGSLGADDLYIRVKPHDLKIHFCHEGDLHVSFDAVTPLVEGVIKYLFRSYSTIAVDKQRGVPRIFPFGLPIFLCSVALTNEAEATQNIKLLPWDKRLLLEPGEELQVTGYSQSPGLLSIIVFDGSYIAIGWPECNVRVTNNSKTVLTLLLGLKTETLQANVIEKAPKCFSVDDHRWSAATLQAR